MELLDFNLRTIFRSRDVKEMKRIRGFIDEHKRIVARHFFPGNPFGAGAAVGMLLKYCELRIHYMYNNKDRKTRNAYNSIRDILIADGWIRKEDIS